MNRFDFGTFTDVGGTSVPLPKNPRWSTMVSNGQSLSEGRVSTEFDIPLGGRPLMR